MSVPGGWTLDDWEGHVRAQLDRVDVEPPVVEVHRDDELLEGAGVVRATITLSPAHSRLLLRRLEREIAP